jgi:murein DD-endopeptidase MepM/ murein hydrolase activator NlpD
MAKRLLPLLVLVLIVTAPAAADTIFEKKRAVDSRLERLRSKLEQTRSREEALEREIARVSGEILELEHQVGDVSQQLVPLERELHLRELKLNRLNALYQVQSEQLTFLRGEYAVSQARLALRLDAVYRADEPTELEFLLAARSFSDLLDGLDLAREIADQDKQIADSVTAAKSEVTVARKRTARARESVERQAEVVAVRVRQVKELRDELLVSQHQLESTRSQKKTRLDELSEEERREAQEIDALQESSAELGAKIRALQQPSSSSPPVVRSASSASGFIWPVNAPLTSPFGWRWGRMHEGIDLGAGEGTPILAAASGTVIYAGWLGGYGNLVVLDHGGGLSTAYGHQSRIAAGVGQAVSQGQVIGYVGNTGHSFGPHLHFEVRVNGAPVDPLGYL